MLLECLVKILIYVMIFGKRILDEIVDLLSEVKPVDWKTLLGGWVFAGDYRKVAYGDFDDPDCDGSDTCRDDRVRPVPPVPTGVPKKSVLWMWYWPSVQT